MTTYFGLVQNLIWSFLFKTWDYGLILIKTEKIIRDFKEARYLVDKMQKQKKKNKIKCQ